MTFNKEGNESGGKQSQWGTKAMRPRHGGDADKTYKNCKDGWLETAGLKKKIFAFV